MRKGIMTGLCALFFIACTAAPAFAQELLVGGQAVGIQISTDGVIVAGFCPVETEEGAVTLEVVKDFNVGLDRMRFEPR